MTVDDLKQFYGVQRDCDLAEKLQRNKSVISYWRKGIPLPTQAQFELISKGKLKADLSKSKLAIAMKS
ncbi:hypothetical protein [Acinetobacter sp. c3-l95]|uniref:hypothetical protein n=1 Tax=Acinetobacter sp. c3-l95 TaxID=3342804 RepID=UPI0035B7FAB4